VSGSNCDLTARLGHVRFTPGSDGHIDQGGSAFQSSGEFHRAILDTAPISPATDFECQGMFRADRAFDYRVDQCQNHAEIFCGFKFSASASASALGQHCIHRPG
jgi:hypothetical protein